VPAAGVEDQAGPLLGVQGHEHPGRRDQGAKFYGLYTLRLAAPLNSGHGYIYFFPLGMTEAAQVYLSDDEEKTFYSLVVHPLTGRVQIYNRYVEPPVEEQYDDKGNRIV